MESCFRIDISNGRKRSTKQTRIQTNHWSGQVRLLFGQAPPQKKISNKLLFVKAEITTTNKAISTNCGSSLDKRFFKNPIKYDSPCVNIAL